MKTEIRVKGFLDVPRTLQRFHLFGEDPANRLSPGVFRRAVKVAGCWRGYEVRWTGGVEGARLMLRVTDTGVGIAADDLKRIGDPFFQAGKTYQRRHEGTGLGLSIVKSLVALHAGELTVQSRIDEGTTVTVTLPLAYTPPSKQPSNIATLNPASRQAAPDQALQVKKSA